MKKSTKIIGGTFAIAVAAAAAAIPVFAYQGDYSQKDPNCTEEKRAIIEQAFENNDYDSWLKQMKNKGRVKNVITEENFAQFAEAHRLGQAGDIEGADKIRQELGLRTSNGEKIGAGYHRGQDESGSNFKKGYRGMGGRNHEMNCNGEFIDADGDGACDNLQ